LTTQAKQGLYALLSVIGVIATWYCNLHFIAEHGGFSLTQYLYDNYYSEGRINMASASISNDIIVVAMVFMFWSYQEAKTLNMKNWWLYVVLTFGVAIAFSYPLFLLMRERRLEALRSNHTSAKQAEFSG